MTQLTLKTTAIGGKYFIQQLAGSAAGATFTSLRALKTTTMRPGLTTDNYLFLVGTLQTHTLYTLTSLLNSRALNDDFALAEDSDDPSCFDPIDCPSASFPPLLHSSLADSEYEALILRMLGKPTAHLSEDVKHATMEKMAELNYAFAPVHEPSELIRAHMEARAAAEMAELTPDTPHADPEAPVPADFTPAEPVDLKNMQFPIRILTEEEQLAFTRKTRPARESAPHKWPWAKLEVWGQTVIPAVLAERAQRAVHSYAAVSGKIFKTKRDPLGRLTVTRQPGMRPVKRQMG